MQKKMVNHPLFHEPVEITHALVTVAAATIYAQEDRDNSDYALMMEAADHIRALEAKADFLYKALRNREDYIYNTTHLYLGDNNE